MAGIALAVASLVLLMRLLASSDVQRREAARYPKKALHVVHEHLRLFERCEMSRRAA